MKTRIHFTTKPGRYQATGSSARLAEELYGPTAALKESGVPLPDGTTIDDWSFIDAEGRVRTHEAVSTLIDANADGYIPEGELRFCCITFTFSRNELLAMGDTVKQRLARFRLFASKVALMPASRLMNAHGNPLYYTIARLRYDSDGFPAISWSMLLSLCPKALECIEEFDMTEEQMRQFITLNNTMMS